MFEFLFGGGKTTEKVVDGISKGLDKLVYTEEEKSEASRLGVELFIKYQEATQPQNLARRLVALIVTGMWAFTIGLGLAMYKVDPVYSKYILDILQTIIMPSFVVIVSFYFWKRIKE